MWLGVDAVGAGEAVGVREAGGGESVGSHEAVWTREAAGIGYAFVSREALVGGGQAFVTGQAFVSAGQGLLTGQVVAAGRTVVVGRSVVVRRTVVAGEALMAGQSCQAFIRAQAFVTGEALLTRQGLPARQALVTGGTFVGLLPLTDAPSALRFTVLPAAPLDDLPVTAPARRASALPGPVTGLMPAPRGGPVSPGRRAPDLPLDEVLHEPDQLGGFEGLGEEGVDAEVEAGLDLVLGARADDGDGQVLRTGIGAEPGGGAEPVQPGHDDVERHDIGAHLMHHIQTLGTIGRGHDL